MHHQVKLQLSGPRHKTTEQLLSSLVSALLLFSGLAYAEPASSEDSLYSIRDLPQLADYRFDDRDQHTRDAHDPRKHREPSHPRRDNRDRRDPKLRVYETESRERYHPPRHHRVEPPVIVQHRYRRPWRPQHHPRERILVRPFRYVYPHHRPHYHDGNIWGLLTFTAITLAILDNLNDQQQREHERALYDATTTPLGETIYWKEGNASGAVTPTREGTSSSGRYCREYQSEVSIGGKLESIYGTACRNADGSWEIEQ